MTGVLLVLVAMVAVNLREFLPQRAVATQGLAFDDEPLTPPPDLNRITAAVEQQLRGDRPRSGQAAPTADSNRNPFSYLLAGAPAKPKAAAPVAMRTAGPRLQCTAIFVGNGPPAALVDGRVVAAGDRVGEYTVMAINDKGVTLSAGTRTRFLAVEQRGRGGAVGAPISLR